MLTRLYVVKLNRRQKIVQMNQRLEKKKYIFTNLEADLVSLFVAIVRCRGLLIVLVLHIPDQGCQRHNLTYIFILQCSPRSNIQEIIFIEYMKSISNIPHLGGERNAKRS